jgi:tetratricopeptide (TPR) repeat protein
MNHTTLGQRIRLARKEKSMTQHDLANGIVTSSMICQIENGKAFPSYQVLSALAERLEKPIEYFVSDTDATKRQRSTYTLAKALMAAGSYEKAYALLKSLQDATLSEPEDFWLTFSECCQFLGKYEEASLPLDNLLSVAMSQQNYKQMFELLKRLGDIAAASGQYQLALYHWQKAYDLLEKTTVEGALKSKLLLSMGVTYYKMEMVEEALSLLQRAYNEREAFASLEELGRMYLALALSYREKNDFQKATYFSEQAHTLFKSVANLQMTIDVKRSLAVVLARQGRVEEALPMLYECIENYSRHNDVYNIGLTQLELATVLHQTGQTEHAIPLLEETLEIFAGHELERARAHRLLADMYHMRRDLQGAVTHLNRSVHLYQKLGDSVGMVEAMNLSVQLYKEWERHTGNLFSA